MPRFSLTQLFMVIALVPIALILPQSEGCGTRYSMVETLSFSADDSRIAVSKLTGRDAQTPMKFYKANVARTVSWIDVGSGQSTGIVHQDFKPGNCGPASRHWRQGRTSAACSPASDLIAMSAFGSGDLTLEINGAKPVTVPLPYPANNITFSRSGRYVAASGMEGFSVVDANTGRVTMGGQEFGLFYIRASFPAFTNDESSVVVAGESGIAVWDIATAIRTSTVLQNHKTFIHGVAVAPDDTVIVCSDSWVRRYNLEGNVVADIDATGGFTGCCVSKDGSLLVLAGQGQIRIFSLPSNNILRTVSVESVTALAISNDAKHIAIGDYSGRVSLFNAATGILEWESSPPGRHRWPWPLPLTFLAGWCCIAWRLSFRSKRDGLPAG